MRRQIKVTDKSSKPVLIPVRSTANHRVCLGNCIMINVKSLQKFNKLAGRL